MGGVKGVAMGGGTSMLQSLAYINKLPLVHELTFASFTNEAELAATLHS